MSCGHSFGTISCRAYDDCSDDSLLDIDWRADTLSKAKYSDSKITQVLHTAIYSNGTEEETKERYEQGGAKHFIHVFGWLRGIFMDNRTKIANGGDRALLRHLGLQGPVYTCVLLPAGASDGKTSFSTNQDGRKWLYDVVEVDEDEATRFEIVREWNEGIARLRVGGGEDPSRNSQ